jgi:hypothetical protein
MSLRRGGLLLIATSLSLGAIGTLGGVALADKPEKKKGASPSAIAEVPTTYVSGRPNRPSAIVELAKILPESEPQKQKLPVAQKVEAAVASDPF